jgi:Bacterioferritin (cytochrome b1)
MAAPSQRNAKKQKVIDVLNKAREMELYAIHQYMHHHYTLDSADYGELASKMKAIAIDEMRHAEWLAERIKELDGDPSVRMDGTVKKGQKARELYAFDRELEDDTLLKYNEFLQTCRDCNDYVSANLFERLIMQEQDHRNQFDNTDSHIKELGDYFMGRMASSGGAD